MGDLPLGRQEEITVVTVIFVTLEVMAKDTSNGKRLNFSKEWTVGTQFAKGGFGRVFEVTSDGDDQRYVAKFIPKAPGATRELLFVELKDVRNVIPIVDSGETDDDYVIVMPRADQSLRQYMDEKGELESAETSEILRDVVGALSDLEGGVVHRDIKPENILLLDGVWHLADFGIARYAEKATSSDTWKSALSAQYAAPERWKMQRATFATDVYSVGIIAFELLVGELPFLGPTIEDFSEQHQYSRPARVEGVPSALSDLIDEALFKGPETRPRPKNLLARLEGITDEQPVLVIPSLQHANSAEVKRAGEEDARKALVNLGFERRQELQVSAALALQTISYTLRDAISRSAPMASLAGNSDVSWFFRLNKATLELPPMSNPLITDWEYGNEPAFEVVATAEIILKSTPNPYGYEGRSHSLWFCDAHNVGEFAWYETAFAISPLIQRSSSIEPFALDPGKKAAEAIAPIMAGTIVAWPFTLLQGEGLTDFVQRWGTWFGDASNRGAQAPTQSPERDANNTWRK